jgi:hypothetical protein
MVGYVMLTNMLVIYRLTYEFGTRVCTIAPLIWSWFRSVNEQLTVNYRFVEHFTLLFWLSEIGPIYEEFIFI